jgi:hypothetical protein
MPDFSDRKMSVSERPGDGCMPVSDHFSPASSTNVGAKSMKRLELFNVRTDPAEQRDLAAEEPARVKTLARRFVEEARRTLVLPAP